MRLRGAFDEEDSGAGRTEGPSWNDDSSYDDDEDDDADLVDLSEIEKGDGENETNTDGGPVAQEEKFEDGGGGTIEDLLSKFLERQEDESDSDDITHEWIRNMPESLKHDAEFMAEFDRLGETLIAKRNLPRPSLAERVHAKFVAAAQEGKEELVKYEPCALLTLCSMRPCLCRANRRFFCPMCTAALCVLHMCSTSNNDTHVRTHSTPGRSSTSTRKTLRATS